MQLIIQLTNRKAFNMRAIETNYMEVATVSEAIVFYRGNQTALAKDLGVARNTARAMVLDGDNKYLKVIRDNSMLVGFELINK